MLSSLIVHTSAGRRCLARSAVSYLFFIMLLSISQLSITEASENPPPGNAQVHIDYGTKGFEFGSADGNYLMQFQSRFQFRYTYRFVDEGVDFGDYQSVGQNTFRVNRARLKIGGHAYRPWIKYFFEYELVASALLDYRFMIEKLSYLSFKAGQWKSHYNRERVISSGSQQMLDRSMINPYFTVDRQQGISLYGHLDGRGSADFNYWMSVFSGTGRSARENDDAFPMFLLRAQWNVFGRELDFSGSDIDFNKHLAGILALAAVTNQSPYTKFSQNGGGQLSGFEAGEPGQYRVNQWMEETALKYRGFSWQQEFHWKRIHDQVNVSTTTMIGNYMQFGYFFHHVWSAIPEPLELAFRHSFYIPDLQQSSEQQHELSLAANWFFNAHLNKLTMQCTYMRFMDTAIGLQEDLWLALQWDISI